MKPTSVKILLLLLAFVVTANISAQDFFDDVYFTTTEKAKTEKKAEEKQSSVKKDATAETKSKAVATAKATSVAKASDDADRDVDAYNRRYTSENVEEDEVKEAAEKAEVTSAPERRSDTEYTERIVRYHSPSKITIAGADRVNLYLDEGYYSYDYDMDYTGGVDVNLNINLGSPWYDPWYYSSWYRPWYYGYYSPWWSYSWYSPWYWGWGGFYADRIMVITIMDLYTNIIRQPDVLRQVGQAGQMAVAVRQHRWRDEAAEEAVQLL